VQRLLNAAEWDVEAVRDELRDYVVEQLGEPSGVLIVDETGFLKKGAKSVGVQRQYSGTAGRIENCQVGVFLAYATSNGQAFLDRELYLPQEWADDAAHRAEAGVPTTRAFATKPALARQLLARAFAAQVPATWVTGDEIYGDDTDLRRWLEEEGHPYVLAVSASHPIWHDGTPERAEALVAALPAAAWGRCSAGAGSQGERIVPLLPPLRRHLHDDRTLLAGMLWVVQSGTSWRALPEQFGPWQTVYSCYQRWRRAGVWQHILDTFTQTNEIAGTQVPL
jgi:SRSO17 transposase